MFRYSWFPSPGRLVVLVPLARWGVVSSPWGPPVEGLYNHPTTSPARSNTSFMSGDLIMNLFSNEHSQKQLRNSQLCTLTCKCRWLVWSYVCILSGDVTSSFKSEATSPDCIGVIPYNTCINSTFVEMWPLQNCTKLGVCMGDGKITSQEKKRVCTHYGFWAWKMTKSSTFRSKSRGFWHFLINSSSEAIVCTNPFFFWDVILPFPIHTPSFVQFWRGHISTKVELIWNYPLTIMIYLYGPSLIVATGLVYFWAAYVLLRGLFLRGVYYCWGTRFCGRSIFLLVFFGACTCMHGNKLNSLLLAWFNMHGAVWNEDKTTCRVSCIFWLVLDCLLCIRCWQHEWICCYAWYICAFWNDNSLDSYTFYTCTLV